MITKAFPAELKVEEGERAVTAKISTVSLDRDGEVMIPGGCSTKNYEKNPVVLYNHDKLALPVGKCVALSRDEKGITAKTVFAKRPENYPAEAEWLPDTLLSLFQQGILKAFSVGFTPLDMPRQPTKKDIETYGDGVRRIFGKWEMYEYSVVTLPANQDAVALSVSKSADAMATFIEPPKEIIKPSKAFTYILTTQSNFNFKSTVDSAVANELRKAKGFAYSI